MKKIAILNASSATVEIHTLPRHLQNSDEQCIKEFYQLDNDSDYILGELTITID